MSQCDNKSRRNILLVKTSSLGDIVHSFPALTDAVKASPGIEFHWLVEEAFAEVPRWHPAVSRVITVSLRRWRKGWRQAWRAGELSAFWGALRSQRYDLIIDAQGLLKSAIPARMAQGVSVGYDRSSIREPVASNLYHRRYVVSKDLHAIERIRHLFASVIGYEYSATVPDYGLGLQRLKPRSRNLVFLHATTWPSKHWPEPYWIELTQLCHVAGYSAQFPWHTAEERGRAERIIDRAGCGELLPNLTLTALKNHLLTVGGVVGVDSGLAHITAAVDTPAVTLYGPTSKRLTGAVGKVQKNLQVEVACSPCMKKICEKAPQGSMTQECFKAITPAYVWQVLEEQMQSMT